MGDFERGFICAEVMAFDELKEKGSEAEMKKVGRPARRERTTRSRMAMSSSSSSTLLRRRRRSEGLALKIRSLDLFLVTGLARAWLKTVRRTKHVHEKILSFHLARIRLRVFYSKFLIFV